MKTRIIKLRNNEMEITLCGAIHIGTQEYFDRLNGIADESDFVLYEGVKSEQTKRLMAVYEKLAELLELKVQSMGDYKDSSKWENSDLEYNVLEKFAGEKFKSMLNGSGANNFIELLEETEGDPKQRKYLRLFVLFLLKTMSIREFFRKKNYVLNNLRNYNLLINLVKKLESHKKVAVIYGEGHLRHLLKELKMLNFKVVETYKLSAFKTNL
jgi:hypothetical protein